jgi:predicted acetyltransferase
MPAMGRSGTMHAMTMSTRPSDAPPAGIEIRPPREDEQRRFLEPLGIAFAEEIDDEDYEQHRSTLEWDRVFGALDGDRVVGCSGVLTFELTVPGGGTVGTAGVTAVAVRPDQRRRGILRAMMRRLLDQARDRREPTAALWASEGAIYQRYGFGLGTIQASFDIDRARLVFRTPVEPAGSVRLVDIDEAARRFPAIYELERRQTAGSLSRTDPIWRHHLLVDSAALRGAIGRKHLAALEVDGVLRGYAVYRARADWDERGPKGVLTVLEAVADSPAGERTLWRWLLDVDLMGTIRASRQAVPHPLQLQLLDPRRLGMTVMDGLWLRILDIPAALEARTYAGDGRIVLEIRDGFYPENDGSWSVEAMAGAGRVARAAEPAEMRLEISDLAAVYLGTFRFSQLVQAGRAEELAANAAARADALFAVDRVASCSTIF